MARDGRLKSHIADNQVITLRTLLFLQLFNYLGHFWCKQVYCYLNFTLSRIFRCTVATRIAIFW